MEILNNAIAILMVVFGLGFVIFIHELGHFLLAKWNGVKVEKFAIGFDVKGLKLYSRKVGETEYVLGALPLGGYVKMLGEDAVTGNAEEPGEPSNDPRAYHNRPVGARMAIITAGVIMNLIFGLLCFMFVYLRGKDETPPVIGSVVAGQPAYEAGLRAGDRVVAVNDQPIETYSDLQHAAVFSGRGQTLRLQIERPGVEERLPIAVVPQKRQGGLAPTVGITSGGSLQLIESLPFLPTAGFTGDADAIREALQGGGRLVAAGPPGGPSTELTTEIELDRLRLDHREAPLELKIERPAPGGDASGDRRPATLTATIPPSLFVDFGFRLTLGPIVAIRQGSPAEKAGFLPGDRIVSLDGQTDLDPMRFPEIAATRAREKQSMTVEVERSAKDSTGTERVTLVVSNLEDEPIWSDDMILPDEPLEVPPLGLAIEVEPRVAAVEPGSPAEKAGLKPGAVLRSVTLTRPDPKVKDEKKPRTSESARSLHLVLDGEPATKEEIRAAWPFVFDWIQGLPTQAIQFTIAGSTDPITMTPAPVEGWYNPRRGLQFEGLKYRLPPQSLPNALRRAWNETVENVVAIYYMIRGLFQQTLSKDAVGGPIKIADWAYSTAQIGLDAFIPFLGILSINLAVINFLPIPPLDGGQFLLLLGELVRGRPLPEKYVGPFTVAGLLVLLALILFVNINDVLGYLF